MNKLRTAAVGFALTVLVAGLTQACGRPGSRPEDQPPGEFKHDQAVYIKEGPESREATFLAADIADLVHPTDPLEFTSFFHFPAPFNRAQAMRWALA